MFAENGKINAVRSADAGKTDRGIFADPACDRK
jgi:hypothetical protein